MSDTPGHAIEATLAAAGSKATYTGAGVSIGGWFLSSEFAVLFGILIGLAGFFMNLYYKWRSDKREQREHEARMEAYK